LLVRLLDGLVIEVDVDGGEDGDKRGLAGGVLPGEVGDSKIDIGLGYPVGFTSAQQSHAQVLFRAVQHQPPTCTNSFIVPQLDV